MVMVDELETLELNAVPADKITVTLPCLVWRRFWWSERTVSCRHPRPPPSGKPCSQPRSCPWCVCDEPLHWTPCSLHRIRGSASDCQRRKTEIRCMHKTRSNPVFFFFFPRYKTLLKHICHVFGSSHFSQPRLERDSRHQLMQMKDQLHFAQRSLYHHQEANKNQKLKKISKILFEIRNTDLWGMARPPSTAPFRAPKTLFPVVVLARPASR